MALLVATGCRETWVDLTPDAELCPAGCRCVCQDADADEDLVDDSGGE